MTCCPAGLHEAWPRGMAEERSMCSRISISISRWRGDGARVADSRRVGGQRWGQHCRGGLAPVASRRTYRTTTGVFSAPRSGASRHLVVGVDVRPDPDHDAKSGRRRVCAARRARAKSQSGQERPPRRRRSAAPSLTPEGVAPALFATSAKVPRRQTSRQMARGGLSTAMRPVVALVVRACHRCLLTDRPLKRCHKTARVAVQFGPETRVATRVEVAAELRGGVVGNHAPHRVPMAGTSRAARRTRRRTPGNEGSQSIMTSACSRREQQNRRDVDHTGRRRKPSPALSPARRRHPPELPGRAGRWG
jgi:hypothetical protein